jgi:hypothetical protein
MNIELDHVFVCASPSAPEAEEFVRFGLREGLRNEHAGQGTSCRRFGFANTMIELLWVSDPRETQSEATQRTLLWDRWSARAGRASPFGVCVRPVHPQNAELPFPAWEYRPAYLPDPLVMHIAESGVEEPMWIHLGFLRRADRERWFTEHPAGIREITGLSLTTPVLPRPKEWSRAKFSQVERERSRFSKLNSTASVEIRWRTLGRTCRSFFDCDCRPYRGQLLIVGWSQRVDAVSHPLSADDARASTHNLDRSSQNRQECDGRCNPEGQPEPIEGHGASNALFGLDGLGYECRDDEQTEVYAKRNA